MFGALARLYLADTQMANVAWHALSYALAIRIKIAYKGLFFAWRG